MRSSKNRFVMKVDEPFDTRRLGQFDDIARMAPVFLDRYRVGKRTHRIKDQQIGVPIELHERIGLVESRIFVLAIGQVDDRLAASGKAVSAVIAGVEPLERGSGKRRHQWLMLLSQAAREFGAELAHNLRARVTVDRYSRPGSISSMTGNNSGNDPIRSDRPACSRCGTGKPRHARISQSADLARPRSVIDCRCMSARQQGSSPCQCRENGKERNPPAGPALREAPPQQICRIVVSSKAMPPTHRGNEPFRAERRMRDRITGGSR